MREFVMRFILGDFAMSIQWTTLMEGKGEERERLCHAKRIPKEFQRKKRVSPKKSAANDS